MSAPLTQDDVRHVAKLARLRLSDEAITEQTTKLGAILKYIDKLSEVDIDGVEPMVHAMELVNVLRPDEVGDSLPVEDALRNAPDRDDNFFKVPKVLGEGSS